MLMTLEQASAQIRTGRPLRIAGDEALLSNLPRGNWIGGTIPYFMTDAGGAFSLDRVFVRALSREVTAFTIRTYDADTLANIVEDAPDNGYSVVILPGMSEIHSHYARCAPDIDGLFTKPIVGWIAGIDLAQMGRMTPKAFNGSTGQALDNKAVVMHATLPDSMMAEVGIVNLFEQGAGDVLTFDRDDFTVGDCFVNGRRTNFARYLVDRGIDTRLPLVADYNGEMVNVSFRHVDARSGRTDLYAPVFRDVEYRFARPVADYVSHFFERMPADVPSPEFSCNCILNYLYGGLEGRKTAQFAGPITFGEVAYQLVNQTMVYVNVKPLSQ